MDKITPSTKFRVLTVHKMLDTTCWRKFFWSRVLNLEPRKMNWNFWWGALIHIGFESALLGKSWKQIQKLMATESRRRTKRYSLTSDETEELKIQYELISLTIKTCMNLKLEKFDMSRMSLDWAEKQVSYPLERTDVTFCGTLDGQGRFYGNESFCEIKTAKSISSDYFTTLEFDTQVAAYILASKKKKETAPSRCCYCVFRKPSKYVKKGQTVSQFLEEMEQDFKDRPDFYFVTYSFRVGTTTLQETERDIENTAILIKSMYNLISPKELLNPESWPKQTHQCISYGVCPFLLLCKNPTKWKLLLRMYQQREMIYSEERQELQE